MKEAISENFIKLESLLVSFLLASIVFFSLFFIHELGHLIFGIMEGIFRYGAILDFQLSGWIDAGWISLPTRITMGGGLGWFFRFGGPLSTISLALLLTYFFYTSDKKRNRLLFLFPATVAFDEITRNIICGSDNFAGAVPDFCRGISFNQYSVFLTVLVFWWLSYPYVREWISARFRNALDEEIKRTPWTFAKTYAKTAPHEYIVQEKYPELFEKLKKIIEKEGKEEVFLLHGKKIPYKYWYHGDYRYWRMDNILNRCSLKNLTRKDWISYPKVD